MRDVNTSTDRAPAGLRLSAGTIPKIAAVKLIMDQGERRVPMSWSSIRSMMALKRKTRTLSYARQLVLLVGGFEDVAKPEVKSH